MKILYLIPARGGSKGVPGKNIKLLNGKPLINYAIDLARTQANDADICVTTDDTKIIKVVENYGLKVDFIRPEHLASDTSGMEDVLKNAVDFYIQKGMDYDYLLLLQPTSPFRTKEQLKEILDLIDGNTEMIVSVKETSVNPYYVLFEEDMKGFLTKSKVGDFKSRQECPKVYELNGAFYVIKIKEMKEKGLQSLSKIKYEMPEISSLDIDTELDWKMAEILINEGVL